MEDHVELSRRPNANLFNLMAKMNERQLSDVENDLGGNSKEFTLMSIRDTNDTLRLRPKNHWDLFKRQGDIPLFNPNSMAYFYWVMIILLATLTSGIYVPYEVGFKDPRLSGKFFWLNRIIDFIFLMDVIMAFNTPFMNHSTGRLVTSRRSIFSKYLKTWLLLDILCLIPFDVIAAVADNGSTNIELLRIIRIIKFLRILRILKVIKVLHEGNIIQMIEISTGIDYYTMSILKFAFIIIFAIHIMACGLHVVAILEDGDRNWVHAYFGTYSEDLNDLSLYITCLYWSAMTTSTIGYGDVGMITDAEKMYSIICMVIGATLYAFMTGNICGTVLRMNQFETDFGELTSELELFLKDNNIDPSLANYARTFLNEKHKSDQPYDDKKIMSLMSPVLRGKIAKGIHKPWMEKTWSLCKVESMLFISQLALIVETKLFSPRERIIRVGAKANRMYIVKKGVAIQGAIEYKVKNDILGEEMIRTPMVRRTYEVNAGMRHVTLIEIEREAFMDLVNKFGSVKKMVKKAAIKLAFREHVLEVIRFMKSGLTSNDTKRLEMDRRKSLEVWEEEDSAQPFFDRSKMMDFLSDSVKNVQFEEKKEEEEIKEEEAEEVKDNGNEGVASWFSGFQL